MTVYPFMGVVFFLCSLGRRRPLEWLVMVSNWVRVVEREVSMRRTQKKKETVFRSILNTVPARKQKKSSGFCLLPACLLACFGMR